MSDQGDLPTNVDIVFCIDVTGSMGPFLANAQNIARNLHESLKTKLKDKNREMTGLRAKVIAFRDFRADGDKAMDETGFFDLNNSDEKAKFVNYIDSLKADGGGPIPENSLEALALAMKSDWIKEGVRRRHIIVLFTDAEAHQLEEAVEDQPEYYPSGMPKNLIELGEMWGLSAQSSAVMDYRSKRLILFAPDAYPWALIANQWPQVSDWIASNAGTGLSEQDIDGILEPIANSAA